MLATTKLGTAVGRRFVTVVLALSAVVQLATLPFVGNRISGGDAQTYLALSKDWSSLARLTSEDAFEGNFWPAGYSGFLHLFDPFGGNQVIAVRLAQILMVLALAAMSASFATSVSQQAARWTLIVVAFSPSLLFGMWSIGYELLLGLLICGALWLLWTRGNRIAAAVTSGIAFALALIVQFRAIAALPVLLYLAWRIGKRTFATWTISLAIPIGLWSLRTYVAMATWAPWSTNGSYNVWNGNGPHATGHNVFPLPPLPTGADSYSAAALTWATQNPFDFFEITARKFLFLFYPTDIAGISDRLPAEALVIAFQWAYSVALVILIILFLGSLVWAKGASLNRMAPVFLAAMLYLLPNVLFIVEARFRIPVEALLLAVAASTAQQWWASRDRTTA